MDRSAAYAGRYVAKNVVAAGIASRCEVQIAYAIGVARPVSLMVETFGTGKISDDKIAKLIERNFDCAHVRLFTLSICYVQFISKLLPMDTSAGMNQNLPGRPLIRHTTSCRCRN